MVKIRLTRIGKKNSPAYRIVVMDSKKKRDGKSIEIIGFYNPSTNPIEHKLDEERYNFWISKGAQATEAVKLIKEGKYKHIPYNPNAAVEETQGESEKVEKEEDTTTEEQTEEKEASNTEKSE